MWKTKPAAEPSQAPRLCPRCQNPLVDPDGLGWCNACGYCRSLEEGAKKVAATPAPPPKRKLATAGFALFRTPLWFWVTVFGLAAVILGTLAVEREMRFTPFTRAVFTTAQIGASIALMFVGQFIGLIRVAPDDPSLTLKDAIVPFRLYALVFKHLPRAQLTLYLGTWGLAAALSAAIVIGGLGHWFTYLPGYKANAGKRIPTVDQQQ